MKESVEKVPIVDASDKFVSEPAENKNIEISKLQTVGYSLLKSDKQYYKNITRL